MSAFCPCRPSTFSRQNSKTFLFIIGLLFLLQQMNDQPQSRIHNVRKIFRNRRIKTEKQQKFFGKQVSQPSSNKCESFLKALKEISLKNNHQPCILNLSIPVRSNHSSKGKLESHESRIIKSKDFFITKLRRKEETRSKLLLQRLESQSKSMSLLELSQKWKQSAIHPHNIRDRGETIKEMKNKIRQRSQFCNSEYRTRTEANLPRSRVKFY